MKHGDLQRRLDRLGWLERALSDDPNGWRVDVEDGRPTVIPRMTDEELEEWGAQVNARIDERRARGRLVPREDGNFSWVRRPLTRYG